MTTPYSDNPVALDDDTKAAEPSEAPVPLALAPAPHKELHWVMLMFMTYIAVFGGGAYSIEAQVATGYPLLTLIGLVVFPWLSGFPLALATAELSSAMPDNGGYLVWLETAFGRFWGFFIGWIRAVNRVIDLSLYPVLFVSYLKEYFDLPNWVSPISAMSMVAVSSVINIFGVKLMGVMAIAFSGIALLPFFIFIAMGATRVDPKTWFILPPSLLKVNWGLWLAVASWNVAGFDTMSHVAGEMKSPKKYYLAMMGAMVLIALSGFVPVALMVSIDRDYSNYYAGYWPQLGQQIAGNWLKLLFVIGACTAMFATFNGYLFYGAMLFSMWAKKGLMSIELLTLTNRYHAPWVAILVHGIIVFFLSFLDFEDLIQVSTALYCISLIMNYVTLVYLRIKRPEMKRPYKIGLGTKGLVAFIAPASLLAILNIFFACLSGWLHFGLILLFIALGPALWFLRRKLENLFPGKCGNSLDPNNREEDEGEQKLNLLTRKTGTDGSIEVSPTPPTKSRSNSVEKNDGKSVLEEIEEAD